MNYVSIKSSELERLNGPCFMYTVWATLCNAEPGWNETIKKPRN